MHLYCMYIVTDSKHTHGPDAWSALCVQMFWLSNPFVRLRPARQFLLPVCCWVGAGWSEVWGGRVWTMMSTQTLIAKAVLPLHIERWIFLVLNTQYVSYTVYNIIEMDISNENLSEVWPWLGWPYYKESEEGTCWCLASEWKHHSPLVWAALSALQLRLGTKLEASAAM